MATADVNRGDKAVVYDDGIPSTAAGQELYPDALRLVGSALSELRGDAIQRPKYFNANIRWLLDLILGRFQSFHDTHRAAQQIHAAYRSDSVQYCVYLRSFSLAGMVLSTRLDGEDPGQSMGLSATDRSYRELVKSALPDGMASVSFINTFDVYPSASQQGEAIEDMRRTTIPSFRVLSHNWRHVVREVIRGANLVVLSVDFATDGITYELELIRECDMVGRTIVATSRMGEAALTDQSAWGEVIDFGDGGASLGGEASTRLAERIRSLAGDGFKQNRKVEDLSALRCWVVDRQIDLAARQFDEETLRDVPYDYYIPRSLARAWSLLTEKFPSMVDEWQALEAATQRGEPLKTDALAHALYSALHVFYVATPLERYYEMAIALATMGMAHRTITGDTGVMLTCYRHAAQCADWHGEPELASFLAGAYAQLQAEVADHDAAERRGAGGPPPQKM